MISGKNIDLISGKNIDLDYETVLANRDENNCIKAYISICFFDIIDTDLEGFLDMISEACIGSPLLMDINYNVVGVNPLDANTLILEVTGDASTHLHLEDEE